jgi:hypothetical protein
MNHFGNFGLGQATTMVNPYFDFGGAFSAQQVRKVTSMVAYYPASMKRRKYEDREYGMGRSTRGFVGGYIGPVAGEPRIMSR